MDIHNNERKEVLKCWRLHLGSSDILKKVVEYTEYNGYSADNPGTFIRFYNQCLSWKNACRKWRESSDTCCYSEEKPNCFNSCFDKVYTLYNMFYYALRPFLGVSALYFDICKDITFAILIWNSLDYAAKANATDPTDHQFEYFLYIVLVLSIALTQVIVIVYIVIIPYARHFRPLSNIALPLLFLIGRVKFYVAF